MRDGPDGKEISYEPPRYEYSYDFDIIISVSNPYFDEMRFRLNPSSVTVTQGVSSGVSGNFGRFLDTLASNGFDPMNDRVYRQYYEMAQQICEEIRRIQAVASGTQYIPQSSQQYGQPVEPQYGQPYAPQGGPQYAPQGTPVYPPQGAPQYGQQYAPQGTPPYGQQYAPQGTPPYIQQAAPQPGIVNGPWICPTCHGQNSGGQFCVHCGTQRQ